MRDGNLVLDWSNVESADQQALAALLDGINLDAPPDGLALDAIPIGLGPQVEAILRGNAPKQKQKAPRKKPKAAADGPSVWRPGSSPPSSNTPDKVPKRLRSAPPPSILEKDIPSPAKLRAELEAKVLAELHGPAEGEHEELDERNLRPRDRYLVGVIAPRRMRVVREQMDSLPAGTKGSDEDGTDDDANLSSDTMFPSSIGLSFCVAPNAKLRLRVRWGRYERGSSETKKSDLGHEATVWRRFPMGGEIADFSPAEGAFGPLIADPKQPEVVLRGVARRVGDVLVVSLFLVNTQDEPEKLRDRAWLFQPQIEVRGDNQQAPFVGRPLGRMMSEALARDEDRAVAMLYRDRIEFAVGHGTGVSAQESNEPTHATVVHTRIVPRYELSQREARCPPNGTTSPVQDPNLAGLELDMKELAQTPELARKLEPLIVAYQRWIEAQEALLLAPSARLHGFEDIARKNLAECRRALQRLAEGIDLLASDQQAADAFRFANRAMWLQRIHTVFAERMRRGDAITLEDIDIPENRSWRTFQLAFVLLTMVGLTKLDHPDRTDPVLASADLLWFPTGGGKTEAYLGCTAYVFALRRLQGDVEGRSGEHGVAVLMRYTLRLLTLQQFQRAATLICACEEIRREAQEQGDSRWGHEPFRLGLWVGARTTPNRTEHANEALKQERKASASMGSMFAGHGSPVQLKSCPWCGTAIDPGKHMRVDGFAKGAGRTLVFCGDERGNCRFSARRSPHEGIPVLVVDEEIYRRLPSLLIATVDKFAQMPWNGQVQMLFGHVTGRCTRHGFRSPETQDSDSHPKSGELEPAKTVVHGPLRPPDLIIQDELHLISGPLGTLTALYETAIDDLCTWEVAGKRVRPKVIASTATVRRAREQVHALFARQLAVFPPQGLDAGDDFFAVERSNTEVPGRLYLGICAPGRRLKAAIIRVYVAFLTGAQSLYARYGKHADPWMTLVGYFSSLRELAGTRRLVDDDIRTRAFHMDRLGLSRRSLGEPKELTSRLGATEIPALLDRLEVPFDPSKTEHGDKTRRVRPIDVLLATNMISVGVDVKRLGLMVCAGQPKTTAEYIQATSRVGRSHPGIVCTIYNWARPRDLSHYETFEHYHATFYQHVEALSVTPFASRALDRGLSALLVSLLRQTGPAMNPNAAAANLAPASLEVNRAIDIIVRRAEHVEPERDVGSQVRQALTLRLQEWDAKAKQKPGSAKLGYKPEKDGQTEGLLERAGIGPWSTFTCLNSLRDVEQTVTLLFDEGRMDDAPGGEPGEPETPR
jgi:hypothetical protein